MFVLKVHSEGIEEPDIPLTFAPPKTKLFHNFSKTVFHSTFQIIPGLTSTNTHCPEFSL